MKRKSVLMRSVRTVYRFNLKNWFVLETGMVTVCCPFWTMAEIPTGVQAPDCRSLLVSKVKPGAPKGHDKTTVLPEDWTTPRVGEGPNSAFGPAEKLEAT